MMRMREKKWMMALVLCALMVGLSGCVGSPDSVEDPLSQYSGMGVSSQLPFATNSPTDGELWTPAPTAPPATVPPAVDGYQDLIFGASGAAVSELQGRLKALGYYYGTIDGLFGESTVSAIKLFQEQSGFQKTGLATAVLQEEVFKPTAPRYGAQSDADYDPYEDPDDFGDDEDYGAPTTPKPTQKPTAKPSNDDYEDYDEMNNQPRELARGDKGDQVRELQSALKQLGYYTGNVDGDYGSGTVSAVKRFQAVYGQSQTGIATLALQKKLYSGDAVRYVAPTPKPTPKPTAKPTLKPGEYMELAWGDSGSEVTKLQKRLKALKYLGDGAKAGQFDDLTEKAVKRFQKQYGQTQDGIASVPMQKKLYSEDALSYDGSAQPTPEPAKYVTLKPGDKGDKVKALQRRLKALGYFDGEIGGNYLDITTAAVKRFQKAIGVKQTGEATAALQKELFAEDAPPYKSPDPTPAPTKEDYIGEGDSGEYVTKIQKRLKVLGFFSGSASGGFGPNTKTAVKAFQKACDLEQTGYVTKELYALMMSDEAPSKVKPEVTPAAQQKYVKLSPGDTGERVKALQRRLKALGYFGGNIGGNYLTQTSDAVKAFQKKLGLERTGIATIDLQEKLFADSAPAKGEGDQSDVDLKPLKFKDKGARVEALQLRLIELGFLDEKFGGDKKATYGEGTRQAVIDVQMARNFDSDGNADLEFLTFLMSAEAELLQPLIY